MFTVAYWKAVAERMVKGAAVGVATLLGGDLLPGQFADLDWGNTGQAALYGALASLVLSIVSTPFGPGGSPSLVDDPAPPAPAAERRSPFADDRRRALPDDPPAGQHRAGG